MDIQTKKFIILIIIFFNLRIGLSVRIRSFTTKSPKSETGVIRLSRGQHLTVTCEIVSPGQPYDARIKNENRTEVNSTRDMNDSTLTHTIHQVACQHMGVFECELQDRMTNITTNALQYLLVEGCLPITCEGLQPNFTLVAPLHGSVTLSLCVVADSGRFFDLKFYINGERVKINTVHHKFKFDLERNEPSYIHYTIHIMVVDVTATDYGVYNITTNTGGQYSLTVIATLDGEGEPCPEEWCRTPKRTCLQLLKAGTSYKKSKRICEKLDGTLFNGTIPDSVQCINSTLNKNISDHIIVHEANQSCGAYSLDNHTRKATVECSSTSTFSFVCQKAYWRHLGNDVVLSEPIPSTDTSTITSTIQYASIGSSLIMVLIASFIGVVCYRKRVTATFEKTHRESVYHTLYEAVSDSVRDNDDGNEYDVTVDEPGPENLKARHFKRESIKPAPPPRASDRNKERAINSDKSVYDVCGANITDQPVNEISEENYEKIVNIKGGDEVLRVSDLDSSNIETINIRECNDTLLHQNVPKESNKHCILLNPVTDIQNNANDYSTPLIAQEVHEYSGYVKDSKTNDIESNQTQENTNGSLQTFHRKDIYQIDTDNKIPILPKKCNVKSSSRTNDEDAQIVVNILNKPETFESEEPESSQEYYSPLLNAGEEYSYALFSKNDMSRVFLQGTGDDGGDVYNDEHKDDITDIQLFSKNSTNELSANKNCRISYIELNEKVYKSICEKQLSPCIHDENEKDFIVSSTTDYGEEEYITPVINETYHVLINDCDIKTETDDVKMENAYQHLDDTLIHAKHEKDNIVSNSTNNQEDEYITPIDAENYPVMIHGDGIKTETDDMNKDNFYLQFDGADTDGSHDENNDGYMTWDGGDVSCKDDRYGKDISRAQTSNINENESNGRLQNAEKFNRYHSVHQKTLTQH